MEFHNRFEHMFEKEIQCDVYFKLLHSNNNSKTIGAHKVLLSAASPVFEKLVLRRGTKNDPILIENVSKQGLTCFLR